MAEAEQAQSEEVVEGEDAQVEEAPEQEASEPVVSGVRPESLAQELFAQLHGLDDDAAGDGQSTEDIASETAIRQSDGSLTQAEELPTPRLVQVGDETYDYDFVQEAVKNADHFAELSREAESELAELRTRLDEITKLQELLNAIQGRLGDPTFVDGLQRLLQPGAVTRPSVEPEGGDGDEGWWQEETKAPPPSIDADAIMQQFETRLQQALVPLYAAKGQEASEWYFADLEKKYGIVLEPEKRAEIQGEAIDTGLYRYEHLITREENPLEVPFLRRYGPDLLKRQDAVEEQKRINSQVPESSRHQANGPRQEPRSRQLASQLQRDLQQL